MMAGHHFSWGKQGCEPDYSQYTQKWQASKPDIALAMTQVSRAAPWLPAAMIYPSVACWSSRRLSLSKAWRDPERPRSGSYNLKRPGLPRTQTDGGTDEQTEPTQFKPGGSTSLCGMSQVNPHAAGSGYWARDHGVCGGGKEHPTGARLRQLHRGLALVHESATSNNWPRSQVGFNRPCNYPAAQVRYDVQGATARSELSCLSSEQACTQLIAKECFETKDGRFGYGALMITRCFFPLRAAMSTNEAQRIIARMRRCRRIAMLPAAGIVTQRNRDTRVGRASLHPVIDGALIIRPIRRRPLEPHRSTSQSWAAPTSSSLWL